MIKTRLRNRLSDSNLSRLMKIAVEGPELSSVPFEEILHIFKEQIDTLIKTVFSILVLLNFKSN